MQAFVVAVEYLGADISDTDDGRTGWPRTPALEHAYDLETASLAAHRGRPPRYAFPAHQRGWTTTSDIARCPQCTAGVDAIITAGLASLHPRTTRRRPTPN
jgi:hypothetical protein